MTTFIHKESVAQNILNNISEDHTAEQLSKGMSHKYFRREGAPGNYKYYYTEADWKAGKSSTFEPKDEKPKDSSLPKVVTFLKNNKYFDSMKRDVMAAGSKGTAIEVARDWLNDIDTQRELEGSLMSHAKAFVNYVQHKK